MSTASPTPEFAVEERLYYRRNATQVEEVTVWSNAAPWIGVRYTNASGTTERIHVPPADLYRACLMVAAPADWLPDPLAAAGHVVVREPGARRRGQRRYRILTNDPTDAQAIITADPLLTLVPAEDPRPAP